MGKLKVTVVPGIWPEKAGCITVSTNHTILLLLLRIHTAPGWPLAPSPRSTGVTSVCCKAWWNAGCHLCPRKLPSSHLVSGRSWLEMGWNGAKKGNCEGLLVQACILAQIRSSGLVTAAEAQICRLGLIAPKFSPFRAAFSLRLISRNTSTERQFTPETVCRSTWGRDTSFWTPHLGLLNPSLKILPCVILEKSLNSPGPQFVSLRLIFLTFEREKKHSWILTTVQQGLW